MWKTTLTQFLCRNPSRTQLSCILSSSNILSQCRFVQSVRPASSWVTFIDLNPLNEEWKSVGLQVRPFTWPNIIRKELVASLQSVITVNEASSGQRNESEPRLKKKMKQQDGVSSRLHQCAFVVGGKGSGRLTSVDQALKEVNVDRIFFDFDTVNHRSFIPLLTEFYTEIFDQLERIVNLSQSSLFYKSDNGPTPSKTIPSAQTVNNVSRFIYSAITSQHPKFPDVLRQFVSDVYTERYPSAISSNPKLLSQLREGRAQKLNGKETDEVLFCRLCSSIRGPLWSVEGRGKCFASCLSIVTMISEYEENSTAYILTNGLTQCYPTGDKSLAYILTVISALAEKNDKPICLILKNIDVLSRSCFLQERGHAFLTRLIDALIDDRILQELRPSKVNIPAFLLTDDSMLILRLLSVAHKSALDLLVAHHDNTKVKSNKSNIKQRSKNVDHLSNDTTHATSDLDAQDWIPSSSPRLKIIMVNDWSKDLVRQIYHSRVTDHLPVVEAVYDSFGGKASYLQRIAKGINETDATMQKELYAKDMHLVKELRVTRDEIIDLRSDATAQEKVEYERLQRQQFYIRDVLATEFPREIVQFQWKMNQFLSLPILEQLRFQCKTHVTYFVTVLETIRILLSQEYWTINETELSEISHPVILGLIDVKAFVIQFQPTIRIQPYDVLTRNLLHSFINEKFESLSWINRVKYNSTFASNSKDLRSRVIHMTKDWKS